MMFEQQPVLETIPEEVQRTPVKETLKSHILEDCQSTDEGTFASPSSDESRFASDSETSSAQCADSLGGSPGPSSSCTSDDEHGDNSGQEADVDSCDSGLNSSCTSDEEDFSDSTRRESNPSPFDKLPSVGSVGHYAGQCSRCCFFPKGRCTNGENCNFCHLDHERVRRKRGGAKKAAKAAEEAEKAMLEPKALFKDEADEEESSKPEPKETNKQESKVPIASEEPAFTRSLLQAKGEVVMTSLVNKPLSNMQAVQPVVAAPAPLEDKQRIPAMPCARSSTPIAEQLTSKLLAVTAGRPVKVWLPPDVQPLKRLDALLPAKKKPSFPEYATDKKKTLDPSMPCKKHMPSWLANLDAVPAPPKPKPQTIAKVSQAPVSTADPAPR